MTIQPEPYRSLKKASELLGVPTYALRSAAKRGDFPMYQPFSKRWVVKISEVETAIRNLRVGGADQ
jgi:hypothetical protein